MRVVSASRLCPLPLAFYARPANAVARALLGKLLVRSAGDGCFSGVITETEAYLGPHDLACHSSRGVTPRTEVMFRGGGIAYVYRIYGLHWMLNIVTGAVGDGAAVLIRSVTEISGPGRVARAFDIDGHLNGQPLDRKTGLWIADAGLRIGRRAITTTARIGVGYAGPEWSQRRLRYLLVEKVPPVQSDGSVKA